MARLPVSIPAPASCRTEPSVATMSSWPSRWVSCDAASWTTSFWASSFNTPPPKLMSLASTRLPPVDCNTSWLSESAANTSAAVTVRSPWARTVILPWRAM